MMIMDVAVFNPAYQCSQCLKFCHKQCCETADSICPCSGVPESRGNQELLFTAFPVNHSLAENTMRFYEDYMKPSFLKKDERPQIQSMRSFRNRGLRSAAEEDSDTDTDDILALSVNETSNESPLLNDSAVISGGNPIPPSLYQDDGIVSQSGFLTVIVQQASGIPPLSVVP